MPKMEVYSWKLASPLPAVPVPLADDDPNASLDLATAFTTTYDRAGYDYSLDYTRAVQPPLDEPERAGVEEIPRSSRIAQ